MSHRRSAFACLLVLPLSTALLHDGVVGSVPDAGVAGAEVALLESQGEWHRAAAALHADSTAAAADAATAMARVRTAIRTHDNARALAALDGAAELVPADVTTFARAALLMHAGDFDAAATLLAASAPPPGLENWAVLLRAEAACALGRWTEAAAAGAASNTAVLPPEVKLRWVLVRAQIALATGDAATLERLAPDLTAAARRNDRGGLLVWSMARDAVRRGDPVRARELRTLLLEARTTPAESAYADLLRGPLAPSLLLPLARYEMRSDRHAAARTRLRGAIIAGLPPATRAEARLLVAESWLKSGEPARCLEALERAALDTRSSELDVERLRFRARAARALGRFDTALRAYREIAARFPRHERADDALYEVGWLLEQRRRFGDAERAYLTMARAYPKGTLADDTLLRAGLCALRDHRAAEAAEHFAALLARHPRSTLLDNALYWQMLSQIALGDATGALALRDRLERDFPRSYFTVLARRRVEQGLSAAQPRDHEVAAGATLAQATADDALAVAARAAGAWDAAVASLRDAYGETSSAFELRSRAWRFWLDWGFADEAAIETRWLEREFDGEAAALLELAAHSHARGEHARLVRLGYLLNTRHGDPSRSAALEILSYPAPYSLSMATAATAHGLSHAALLGLARQESAFDPRIDSGAGARGLMQIMPAVGKRLARAAGDAGFHPDALYDPEVALRLGSTLLAAELRQAAGDLPQALAAYNAGGDRAATWKSRIAAGEAPELYTDVVEFYETRTYLKTVLGNAETYRRLYALH